MLSTLFTRTTMQWAAASSSTTGISLGFWTRTRSGGLTQEEIVKTKYVDNIEHFIEQEALRAVLHEMEDRAGLD